MIRLNPLANKEFRQLRGESFHGKRWRSGADGPAGRSRTPWKPTASGTGAKATSASTRPATSPSSPTSGRTQSIDLKELVDQLQARGIQLPILLRFTDILRHRVGEIHDAFQQAIEEFEYQGSYCCVYPIKVNQQRHVVEEILDFGKPFHFGLEAGSKPELLAVLALTNGLDTPIICNGFKDDEFIRMTMLARKIGKQIIPVVEKFTELEAIVRHAEQLKVRPAIGVRVKLAARGAGRWRSSAGYRSKFGLTLTEVLEAVEYLKQRDMADCLQLVHFHLGSQITNIRSIKSALTEAARVYVELHRVGAGVSYLDVGGGLGIDYDGSQTDFESSVNYTLQEYANDVVFRIKSVCDEAGVPHPTIISESGRAVVAYHSLLVFDVLGVSNFDRYDVPPEMPADAPQQISDLFGIYRDLKKKNLLESYHDAVQAVDEALEHVQPRLADDRDARPGGAAVLGACAASCSRSSARWITCRRNCKGWRRCCRTPTSATSPSSSRCRTAGRSSSSSRSCRSIGSTRCRRGGRCWATSPAIRTARSTSSSTCATCATRCNCTPSTASRITWARSCSGAYQEILGDLHNLFGDTNAVHVSLDENGEVNVDTVIKGDTVREVLAYVQYSGRRADGPAAQGCRARGARRARSR